MYTVCSFEKDLDCKIQVKATQSHTNPQHVPCMSGFDLLLGMLYPHITVQTMTMLNQIKIFAEEL